MFKVRLTNTLYGMVLSVPGLILLLAWVLIPFVYVVILSFFRYDNMSPVVFTGVDNYVDVITNPNFFSILGRTFIFALGSTSLTVITSVLLAVCLNRLVRGAAFFRSLVVMPWAVPLILSGFLWAWMFNPSFGPISDLLMKLGIRSSALNIYKDPLSALTGVIIADAWRRIPFLTIIALAAFQAIPAELYDAASVDGADSFQSFGYVTLPLGSRPIMTGTLITLMFSLRSIDTIYSMTPGGGYGKSTYVLGAFLFDSLYEFLNFGHAAALSVLLILLTFTVGAYFIYSTVKPN